MSAKLHHPSIGNDISSGNDLGTQETLHSNQEDSGGFLQSVCLFFCVDAQGLIKSFNHADQNLLGRLPSELVGQAYRSIFDFELPLGLVITHARDNHSIPMTPLPRIAMVRNDQGEVTFWEIHEENPPSTSANSDCLNVMAFDVSKYVNGIKSLSQSQRVYRSLVESLGSDTLLFSHLPDGEITYLSPSIKEVLGFNSQELVGVNWKRLIGEENFQKLKAEYSQDDDPSGEPFRKYTLPVANSAGEQRLLEIQQRPLFSSSGSYISMEGIAHDITETTHNAEELKRLKEKLEERVAERTIELVRTNKQLAESESRYRSVVEDQTEYICRWDQGGVYTFVNEAYSRNWGTSADALLGTSFVPKIIDDDRERVLAEIASLTPESPTITSEHRVSGPNGTVRWNQWTNRALFDDQGRLTGYQSVGRDITDLRMIEELVQEREDHLKRVSRLATMGELIAGIAHEIHQPLHAAQLFAEATRRNLESSGAAGIPTAIECTREISNAISRTAEIIRQLRGFITSKPSQFELLDLNEVLHEVTAILNYESTKTGVKLHLALVDNSPLVNADRVQMQQVFVHWFRNAFEAMSGNDPGDRDLFVSTRYVNNKMIVEICDNGAGTDVEDLDRLFDAFYTSKPGRLGMGLSICKTIADSHKAQLSAGAIPLVA